VIWFFVVLAVVLVFAIAAATVGREAFRLGHAPPSTIFDLDEAVHHVADTLPDDVQARMTYDEVRELVLAELDHLEAKGVSAMPGHDPDVPDDTEEPVVVDDDDTVAAMLGHATETGLDVVDEDVVRVVEALHGYLVEIGAVGPQAPPVDEADRRGA
jgi:hypothetical protein